MGKRHRRYGRKKPNAGAALAALIILCILTQQWAILIIAALAVVLGLWIRNKKRNAYETKETTQYAPAKTTPVPPATPASYSSKGSIMTDCEKEYFNTFRQLVEPKYTVQPQINLAAIVSKESYSKYRNELFRNIDFGIFDKDYNIKVLIEINDKTHTQADRIQRDKKVNQICAEAGIPLVTFWTKYGINPDYIKDRLAEHIDLDSNTSVPAVDMRNIDDYKPTDFL